MLQLDNFCQFVVQYRVARHYHSGFKEVLIP